jgi:hypothetical protein
MSTFVYPARAGVSIRRIALPLEHGGWSLAGEPVVLGLIAAPSAAGAFAGVAAIMAFLARQPVKIFLGDLYRGRLFPRSKAALAVASIYLALGALALTAAVAVANATLLWPILFAFPFAAVQIAYDGANESRGMLQEICGATSIASVAAMIALAAGWTNESAYLLWIVAASRHITAILYVRARLMIERRRRGLLTRREPGGRVAAVVTHLTLVALAASLIATRGYGWYALLAAALLAGRCLHGLTALESTTARKIGIAEIAYGVAFTVLTGTSTW